MHLGWGVQGIILLQVYNYLVYHIVNIIIVYHLRQYYHAYHKYLSVIL